MPETPTIINKIGKSTSDFSQQIFPSHDDSVRLQYFNIFSRPHQPLDIAKTKYDQILIGAGKKLWRGMLAVAASGFGKGALVTIGITLAVMAMVTGYMGYANALQIGGRVINTFEGGFTAGIAKGLEFLTTKFGIAFMAIGGTLGAVSEVHKSQNKISAEIAQARSQEFEIARQLQHANGVAPQKTDTVKPWDQVPETSFVEQEMQRRQAEQAAGRIPG